MDNANKRLILPAIGMTLAMASATALAQKACMVVTQDEAQAVASAKVGNGIESQIAAMNMTNCAYVGPGKDSMPALTVTVTEAAKMYPGLSTAQLKTQIFGAGSIDKDKVPIPGIGDAATYKQFSSTKTQAMALVKGKIVILNFEAADATAKKDKLIGVLKSAVSRL